MLSDATLLARAADTTVPHLLLALIAILVSAKLLGEVAERVGQPAVLGELLAGVLLGSSLLGVVDPHDPVIHLLAEIGVILLLFQIGLETDLSRLLRVGLTSTTVAIVGVLLPFTGGYFVSRALGLAQLPAVVAGAALTATLVGITARVLSDLGRLHDPESQVVLGAAVIDDIIGLVILAVVDQVVEGAQLTAHGIATTTLSAFGFVAITVVLGRMLVPRLFDLLARLGREETLASMAIALAFTVCFLAFEAGSALIIGAFAAGLTLAPTRHARTVEHGVLHLGMFFVPIFFVSVGASVDVRSFAEPRIALVGGALIVVAILGKVLAGLAPFWMRGNKLVVGVGMIPRGEVGLIFAQMGLATGALDTGIFSAITMMVMVTTLITPPVLRVLFPPIRGRPHEDAGAVAELTTEA